MGFPPEPDPPRHVQGDPLGHLGGMPVVPPDQVIRTRGRHGPDRILRPDPRPARPKVFCACGEEALPAAERWSAQWLAEGKHDPECEGCRQRRRFTARIHGTAEAEGAPPDGEDWKWAVSADVAPLHTHVQAQVWTAPDDAEQPLTLLYVTDASPRLWHVRDAGVRPDGSTFDLWLDDDAHLFAAGDPTQLPPSTDWRRDPAHPTGRYLVERDRPSLPDWPRPPELSPPRRRGGGSRWRSDQHLPDFTAAAWPAQTASIRPRRGLLRRPGPAETEICDMQLLWLPWEYSGYSAWLTRAMEIVFAAFEVPGRSPTPLT